MSPKKKNADNAAHFQNDENRPAELRHGMRPKGHRCLRKTYNEATDRRRQARP